MERTHKGLSRLLSVFLSLALLASLLPAAVAASSSKTISKDMDSDETLQISYQEFDAICENQTGYDTFDTILFYNLPTSRTGTFYYTSSRNGSEYKVVEDKELGYNNFYYLVFEPYADFDGTATISFKGYAGKESFSGKVEIEVYGASSSSSGDLTYKIDVNDTFDFDVNDFDDYCYDETSRGQKVDYIYFSTLPSSSQGTLYLDYGYSSQTTVSRNGTYDRSDIKYLTFVPKRNYEGTVTISFSGYADSGERISGDLVIVVGGSSSSTAKTGDVTLYTDVNKDVYLDVDDFDDYVYDETSRGDQAAYLWFTSLPSSRQGVLYYEGSRSDTAVSVNDEYRHSQIDSLFFEPYSGFEGSVTIPFKGEADSGESFSGDLVINVGVSDDAEVTVELQGATGSPLAFQAADFNDASVEATGANLNYVIFDYTSGRGGYLYYQYGETNQDQVSSARYYRSSSPSLADITFVPGSATGSTVTIPFDGYATNGKSFRGEVEITFVSLQSPSIISYTSDGTAVRFRASDFSAACAARGGSALVSVQFPSPDLTGGQLYYNFTSPTQYRGEVISSITYSVSGIYMLDLVSFLPRAEQTGLVTIPYVGTDAAGITFNGTVQVLVSAPTASRFNDMGSYSWALSGVEFLAEYGITTGTNDGSTYSPAGTLTRGDYILMLVRTFGLTSTSTDNFSDVRGDEYYASALATAKALGIATADANGSFRPTDPVTREDSMVFLDRAMEQSNRTIPDAYATYLNRFPDGSSVSDYARSAVAAMAQAGVIVGDQASRLNPQGTLTRAEMAVILHRALTL